MTLTDEARRIAERYDDANRMLVRFQKRLAKAWAAMDAEEVDRLWRIAERIERREQERDRG